MTTFFTALFVLLFGWCLVWVAADLWLTLTSRPLPLCDCGRRVVRDDQPCRDYSDCVVHSQALCQPFREWVD